MVAIIVPGNYGYAISTTIPTHNLNTNASSAVIAVALGAIPVLGFVHGMITGKQRKLAKVPYPHSYASIEQCKENVRILFTPLT
jgi:glutathione S-transferase